jgi:hypothetical protein
MSLPVTKGNCPCAIKQPGDVNRPACDAKPGEACQLADLLGEFRIPGGQESAEGLTPPLTKIDIAQLADLYGNDFGDVFILVSSPEVRDAIRLENRTGVPVEEISWLSRASRSTLLGVMRQIREQGRRCSVLWIAVDEFEHYPEEELGNVKLAAISFFSNPFSSSMLESYLRVATSTIYKRELAIENQLLSNLDTGRRVLFRSPEHGTEAVFEHHLTEHWFSLHGPLDYGQQTVLPTGELAVLTDKSGEFTMDSPFALTGALVIKGQPILHRGSDDASPSDTSETFAALANMQQHAVIAHVEGGVIEELSSPVTGDNPLMRVLEALIEREPRYRKIHEVGFGTNAACARMTANNFFGNERWPGLHCGLGLGGYTPFHIDLALTEVDVFIESTDGGISDLYDVLGLPHSQPRVHI